MIRSFIILGVGVALAMPRPVFAQTPVPAPAVIESTQTQAASGSSCCLLAAGTAVDIEISETINSSRHKRGDKFPLRLAKALVIDGHLLVPAGTPGIGEVVHAAAARGGGSPGELLIAARYFDFSGQKLPLRGMKLGIAGGDNTGMAFGVSFAAGPFAMFIRGHEIEIPAGTRANAKTAQDMILPQLPAPSSQTNQE